MVCISTIEHIGMDNSLYTPDSRRQENSPLSYLDAVRELKRILKKGGTLYLTVPYGRYQDHRWFQIFDEAMVERLKKEFAPAQISQIYFKYEDKQWNYSNRLSCQKSCFFDIHAEARIRDDRLAAAESVVCLEMIK